MKYILTDGVEFTKELLADVWHGTDGVDAKACEFPQVNRVLSGYSQNDGIDYFRKPEKDKEYVSGDGSFTSVKEYYQANNGNDFYTYIDEAGYHHIEFKDGVTGVSDVYEDHKEDEHPDDPSVTDGKDSILLENCDEGQPKSFLVYGNMREEDNNVHGVGVYQDIGPHEGKYMIPLCVGSQNILDPAFFENYPEWQNLHIEHPAGTSIYSCHTPCREEGRLTRDARIMCPYSASELLKAGPGKYTVVVEVLENGMRSDPRNTFWILHFATSDYKHPTWGPTGYKYTVDSIRKGDTLKKTCFVFSENPQEGEINYDGFAQFWFYFMNWSDYNVNTTIKISMVKGDYSVKDINDSLVYRNPRVTKFFLDDQLYKVGESCDILDVVAKKVTRNVKRFTILQNTEITSLGENTVKIELPGIKDGSEIIFKTYQEAQSQNLANGEYKIEDGYIYIKDNREDFSSFILGKEIFYELQEAEEDTVETTLNPFYFNQGVNFIYMADTYGALEEEYGYNLNFEKRSAVFGSNIDENDAGMILGIPTYPSKFSVTYYKY